MANFADIIKGNTPVLVDFYADWCGPCKMISPVIKQLSEDMGDRARFLKVDVDKNPKAAAKYQVQGVPTLIVFKKGKQIWRTSGVAPIHILKQALESAENQN